MPLDSKQGSEGLSTSFYDTLLALKNAIKAANHLVPGCIGIAMALSVFTIAIIAKYLEFGLCLNLLIILVTSIIIYATSRNYGESAVALAAGLLALFSVTWDTGKTIGFFVAWISFSLFALLISSINLASEDEEIFLDAALSLSTADTKKVEKELRSISAKAKTKKLGPIERAEVIRLFAYRKLPIEAMQYALQAVETMTIITKADHNLVAVFVVDIYKMFGSVPGPRYQQLLDRVYNVMRESPVSPSEFIIAYNKSRHIALSGNLSPENYFLHLREALEKGISPADVHEYLEGK